LKRFEHNLAIQKDPSGIADWFFVVDPLLSRLSRRESAKMANQTITRLLDAIDPSSNSRFSGTDIQVKKALDALANRLEPTDLRTAINKAEQLWTKATRMIRPLFAYAFAVLAGKLEPQEAAQLTAPLAGQILKDIVAAKNGSGLLYPSESLGFILTTCDKTQIAAMVQTALEKIIELLDTPKSLNAPKSYDLDSMDALRRLADQLDPVQAAKIAAKINEREEGSEDYFHVLPLLLALSLRTDFVSLGEQALILDKWYTRGWVFPIFDYESIFWHPDGFRLWLRFLPKLSTQVLIDLLKRPTCLGRARVAVIQELGKRAEQDFTGIWEMLEWARQQEPKLDLAAPPRVNALG
jgi:hypothetical protein